MAALAPAYPPDSGEPNSAAPLDSVTTVLPGASGASSASRAQWNACATSTSQFLLKVSQVWCCTGLGSGVAPALSTSTPGRYLSISAPATIGSAASPGTGVNDPPSSARSSSSAPRPRATPTTCAPAPARAMAMPRPKPRLAPVTSAVTPAISLSGMTVPLNPRVLGRPYGVFRLYRPAQYPRIAVAATSAETGTGLQGHAGQRGAVSEQPVLDLEIADGGVC